MSMFMFGVLGLLVVIALILELEDYLDYVSGDTDPDLMCWYGN